SLISFIYCIFFFFSSRRRHTRFKCDWSSDVCSSDLKGASPVGPQALALEARLETHLLANHLMKNIKALMFAGALLGAPESSRWWAKGEKLLKRELAEQILADGGHFERSPMYHAEALEDLLDIRTLA